MLLNASHELTNCGLPVQIQDRYVRYKQGNRAIVAWMTRYGPNNLKGRKTLPIKQLIALGTTLCNRIDEIGTLPPDVDFYFQEVIKERAYLSQHYRDFRDCCERDQIDTVNHEHFTNSLKRIHDILLTAGKPNVRTKIVKHRPVNKRLSSTSSIDLPRNSFAHLSLQTHDQSESDDSDDEASSSADTSATSECSHSVTEYSSCLCEDNLDNTDFLDCGGSLGSAVETSIFLKELVRVINTVKSCWVKAGSGGARVAAAAAFTDVLLCKALEITRTFCQIDEGQANVPDLRKRLETLTSIDGHKSEQTNYEICDTARGLCELYDKIQAQANLTVTTIASSAKSVIEHTTEPNSLFTAMVSSLQHAYECRRVSPLTFAGIPCTEELFTTESYVGSVTSATLLSSVVVYMMSASHCAYSSTLAQPSHIAVPRIQALRLANEAVGIVKRFVNDKSIFPCQCTNTLGYRMAQMGRDLESFAKHKCWNIVSQSPLVAGNHVLEIHDLCSYYGMYLFHYRQYVAGVLHTYQALTKLKAMEPVQILEEVCNLFATVLYTTGTRPESGFMASWQRYIGARLRFRKGRKHADHKDTWCMSIPAHTAARSAGLNIQQRSENVKLDPKFDYGTIDQVIKLKRDGWVLSDDSTEVFSSEVKGSSQPSPPPQRSRRNKHSRTKSCCTDEKVPTNQCTRLDHTLAACFDPDPFQRRNLPPGRFNLLTFFHSMTKIVSRISDYTHIEDDKNGTPKNNGRGQMCLCFVQTMLQASDRILDVRKRVRIDASGAIWSKNEKECIECFKKCLTEILEEAKVLDGDGGAWLWSSM